MSILKYTASADTTITDAFKPYSTTRAYYANMGAADSLEIFSIAHSGSSPERSRVLINFPITQISSSRQNGTLPASGSVNFIFKLYNVKHPETLPKNYDVVVKPISGSWDEGYGLDLENYSDNGQLQSGGYGVGWKFRSTTDVPYVWSADGGDFISGYDKSFHFDDGTEDINVDVTDIIEAQVAGIIPSDGIAVMLSGALEDGTNNTNYYTKRFSARSSEYFYKLPSLEARWESLVKDDRNDFYFGSPNLEVSDNIQNIYFYNKVNGVLKNLPSDIIPYVKISNITGSVLTSSIQSTKVSTGVYKASFTVTGSEDSELVDTWYSGSTTYYNSSIDAKVRTFDDTLVDSEYIFAITNLKNSYKNYEFPSIRIFGRQKDWSPNIYTVANKAINTLTFKNLYYKVFRIVDNLTIIDYGIDPIAYTKCSYDKNGNYFDLDMSIFEPGYAYGIKLMMLNGDTKLELPNTYRFKVE
jgi:hypothetical protein